jgi:hypothetical protein
MSRFEFGGYGTPIPETADVQAQDPHVHPKLPIQTLVLDDGQPFRKVDWTSLGYTHYEVWCVGGAGGQGGDAGRQLLWPYRLTVNFESMPNNVFAAWKEGYLYHASSFWVSDAENRAKYYPLGYWPESSPTFITTGYLTFDQYANWMASFIDWPNMDPNVAMAAQTAPHKGRRRYFDPPVLIDDGAAIGGGGGGGGVHLMSGELVDLPDVVPVTVGKAGVDAPVGHLLSDGLFTPSPRALGAVFQQRGDYGTIARNELFPAYEEAYRGWSDVYPGPSPTFLPPQPGQDGGVSSFGDVCMASGGKGGGPGLIWVGGRSQFHGHGGDGGKGGTLVAGGGASGSSDDHFTLDGKNGTWDGAIGTGGGGGRGGSSARPYTFMYKIVFSHAQDTQYFYTQEVQTLYPMYATGYNPLDRYASKGGMGAYSKVDTTVFSEGGPRQSLVSPTTYGSSVAHSSGGAGAAILGGPTGVDQPTLSIFPGAGGGARVNRKYYVGSYRSKMDTRYSPNGLVLLRLMKRGDE